MDVELRHADEVHVISDLHIGGEPGFRMFGAPGTLAAYLQALAVQAGKTRWLVINGDFVDFLAEVPRRAFDARGAGTKLARIMADAEFRPVFDGLRAFLSWPQNHLAIVVGNHDVELALPWVQDVLLGALADGDSARAGRIVWALDGQGLGLRVGGPRGPRVLCLHGNEVDDWNVVDHDAVRRLGREVLRGNAIDEDWTPNAGSRMVIEVMNDIKHEFPFVDLLKPEQEAVVPILLALKPAAAARLGSIVALQGRRLADRARMAAGFLGDGQDGVALGLEQSPETPAGNVTARRPALSRRNDNQRLARALLDRADGRLHTGEEAVDLLASDAGRSFLGLPGAAWGVLRGDPVEAVREALEALDKDRSFDVFHRDETFVALDKQVSSEIDFLVAGHTHLPRAIERHYNRSFYFNSGTWARVLRLDDEHRRDRTRFAALLQALKSRDVAAFDGMLGLIREPPHAVVIRNEGQVTLGELRSFGVGAPAEGLPVPGTTFRRS